MSRLSERIAALEEGVPKSGEPPIRNPEEAAAFFAEIAKRGPTKPRKLTAEETRRNEELDQWYYKSIGVSK